MKIQVCGFELGQPHDLVTAYLQEQGFKKVFEWFNPDTDGEEVTFVFDYEQEDPRELFGLAKKLEELADRQTLVTVSLVSNG